MENIRGKIIAAMILKIFFPLYEPVSPALCLTKVNIMPRGRVRQSIPKNLPRCDEFLNSKGKKDQVIKIKREM